MTPAPPPTTTTPTLAELIRIYQAGVDAAPEAAEETTFKATLTYLLAHESALRREAVLREALTITKQNLEYADYLPDMEPMTTVLAALADSGSAT